MPNSNQGSKKPGFLEHANIQYPIICGAMYPCSNPELIASVSREGGLGVIQPLSMVYAHRHDFTKGMELMRSITDKPFGMNILVEKSTSVYQKRMVEWMDIALKYGVRFFITALGNPSWVIEKVKPFGGVVYHDVTEAKWAEKAVRAGVDGLICVNNFAGGHAGTKTPEQLYRDLSSFQLPLICAGGVGDPQKFRAMLDLGYQGVQMGTRFIATTESKAHNDYKQAIVKAHSENIVLTEKISGVPVSVINTPYVERTGIKAGWLARRLLKHRKFKHWMRLY